MNETMRIAQSMYGKQLPLELVSRLVRVEQLIAKESVTARSPGTLRSRQVIASIILQYELDTLDKDNG